VKKIILGVVMTAVTSIALAWPTKDITLIAPFPPGGNADTHSRAIVEDLEKSLGVKVIVKNMPGGTMSVAINHILSTENDDHTFMWVSDDFLVSSVVKGTDHHKKFVVTNIVSTYSAFIFGGSNASVEKFKQQIARGETVNVGNGGQQSYYHVWSTNLGGNLKVNPVSYRGQAQMVTDILGGSLEYGTGNLAPFLGLVQEGKLVPVMVGSDTRARHLPHVPTMSELGFKEKPVQGWIGFTTRRDTSEEAVRKFSEAIRASTLTNSRVQEYSNQGLNLVNLGHVDAGKFISNALIDIKKFKF